MQLVETNEIIEIKIKVNNGTSQGNGKTTSGNDCK